MSALHPIETLEIAVFHRAKEIKTAEDYHRTRGASVHRGGLRSATRIAATTVAVIAVILTSNMAGSGLGGSQPPNHVVTRGESF